MMVKSIINSLISFYAGGAFCFAMIEYIITRNINPINVINWLYVLLKEVSC